jgi:2-polyprenyl-3-methyl-5-hydroxy-6-metoxy-1,4-benzoquinol methylase
MSRIIHAAHEKMAPHYGDLGMEGQVPGNSLPQWNYQRHVVTPISAMVRDHLPLRPFTMLDAGCGNGQLLHLYARLGASPIYGVDFSQRMLDVAVQRAKLNGIRFIPIRGRLEQLGFFKRPFFHLINLYGVIEHLPHPKQVLGGLERLLMPGGIMIVGIPRKWSLAWLTYLLFTGSVQDLVMREGLLDKIRHRRKMKLYRFYTAREVEAMTASLSTLRPVARIPIAHGGALGPLSKILSRMAQSGNYSALDKWNRQARAIGLIPAGEYVVLKK